MLFFFCKNAFICFIRAITYDNSGPFLFFCKAKKECVRAAVLGSFLFFAKRKKEDENLLDRERKNPVLSKIYKKL
jgi:hypothetical protein